MKIVVIEWQDAQSHDDWIDEESVCGTLADIISCGCLIKETETSYTVAINYDISNGKYSCIMSIPKAWVSRFEEIGSTEKDEKQKNQRPVFNVK